MEKSEYLAAKKPLKNARLEKGWTQQELADKLVEELNYTVNIDTQKIGRWERRDVFPSAEVVPALCKVLGKNAEELGLLWELYHPVEENKKFELEQKEIATVLPSIQAPEFTQQQQKIIHKRHFKKAPWLVFVLGIIVVCIVIAGSILVFVRQISANQPSANTNPVIGSLLYHYQLPKMGSYETLVNALAWSPNSSYLACASGDKLVRIFELGIENEVTIFHGHNMNVNSTVWLPNGMQVASASTDQTVQIWDAFTGKTVMTFTSGAQVWSVAISPDGKEIAWAGKDGIIEVWQIAPQIHLFTYTRQSGSGGIWGLAFSHDGRLLAAGDSTGDIQIIDTKNGNMVLNYAEQTQTIYSLDWSPDDHYIASASGDSVGSNGSVRIWNTSSGKTSYTYEYHQVAMQSISWAPDGTRIASAGADGSVQVWDAFNGKHSFIYKHHSGIVYTVAWSPNGNKIASGDANGDIQVWQAG